VKIGNLEIKYRAIPAPLASISDIVFRKLLDEIGYTGYMVTEMISAEGLRRQMPKTLDMIRPADFNTPQFIQLFGGEPQPLVEAVKFVENETPFAGIDINMGCPAKKIIKKGAGAALLKSPGKIKTITREIRGNTRLPLTVKIRLGFTDINIFEIVKILEEEGVDAIVTHFRLQSDSYSDPAKWEYAPLIKNILREKTVLIGNGDIKTAADAVEKLNIVDGVMIGRGAVINPLIFPEIAGAATNQKQEILDLDWVLHRLVALIEEYYLPHFRLSQVKAYARFLLSNRENSKKSRQRLYTSSSFEEAKKILLNE